MAVIAFNVISHYMGFDTCLFPRASLCLFYSCWKQWTIEIKEKNGIGLLFKLNV